MTLRIAALPASIILSCTALLLFTGGPRLTAGAGQSPRAGVPEYKVDPAWPKPLPQNWLLGGVAGVAVDERDHVWIVHRPRVLTERDQAAGQGPPVNQLTVCCSPAPSVIEFDPEGNVVQAWGGKSGEGYQWPASEHGISVDHEGNVWLTDEGRFQPKREGGNVAQKYSHDGKFLLQIGMYGVAGTDKDLDKFGSVAGATVDPVTDDVYVGEAHGSHRLLVFDAKTGAFRRRVNAYGASELPEAVPGRYDPAAPPPRDFGEVHCVKISRDGLVYVCDRRFNRIQVFKRDGTFVEEIVFVKDGVPQIAPWDLAFSADRDQNYLLVGDGAHMKVSIVQRKPLQVVSSFGRAGRQAGEFLFLNALAVDSKGNLYTGEVTTGDRVQKFTLAPAKGRSK